MVDLSTLSDEDLELMSGGNVQGMSDAGLEALIAGRPQKPSMISRVGDFMGRNAELPGSVAGGLAGAAYGTALGPVGTVVGGIVGGTLGAFGGSLASDAYEGERLNFEEALKEGAISAAFDVATLGAGKVLKPIARSLGVNTADLLVNISGRAKPKPAPQLADLPTNVAFDTPESLRITQQLLEEGGGSLSAAQTGQASFWRRTADEIGQIGLFSGSVSAKRVRANNKVLFTETQSLVNGLDGSLTKTTGDLGEEIYGIVEAGRRAAEQLYGDGLEKITERYGNKTVGLGRLRSLVTDFEKQFTNDIYGNTLAPATQRVIDNLANGVFNAPTGKLTSLLELDRIIGNEIKEAIPGTATGSAKAHRQLSELRTQMRDTMETMLIADKRLPAAGKAYKLLKSTYGESMRDLLPELNASVIRQGSRDNFEAIGRLFQNQGNVKRIESLMKSVKTAYRDVNRANAGKTGDALITPAVKTADDAINMMRQSYMQTIFKDVQGDSVDFTAFRDLAHRLSRKEDLRKSQAIMGESFGRYRRLVNAIANSTKDEKRGLFNLAIRSQEINSVGRLAGTAGAVGGSAAFVGLPLAAAVLTIPSVLAKIATNKRAVNRLLALNGAVKKDPNITPDLIASGLAKVFAELSDEERESLQRDLDRPLEQ